MSSNSWRLAVMVVSGIICLTQKREPSVEIQVSLEIEAVN